ncbi:rod-binding protein [Gammaproteobacteria bacterium]|jgi:flagellar protein FlgJ|nr:rod-binding protein [Gammaproteobacteria bacterium]
MASNIGMPVSSAYDFAGLAALKGTANKAGADQGSVNQKVAEEFESLFLKMMTDSMKASLKPMQSDLLRSDSIDFFDDMFYDEVSKVMAGRQSLGIADWLDSVTSARSGTVIAQEVPTALPVVNLQPARPRKFD